MNAASDELLVAFELHSPDRIRAVLDDGYDLSSKLNGQTPISALTDGLGFIMKRQWTPEGNGDAPSKSKICWCWLELGDAAIMLQEFSPSRRPKEMLGIRASVCFQCVDALALDREFKGRSIITKHPSVEIKCGSLHSPILTAIESSLKAQRMHLKRMS